MSRLRAWRLEQGILLQEISDLSGISVAMLSRAERGERRLSPMTRIRVARSLGVRVAVLFEPDGDVADART